MPTRDYVQSAPRRRGDDESGETSLSAACYRLDESDPDVLFLRREDGTVVAYFSAFGATRETIEKAAWDDYKRRRKNRR